MYAALRVASHVDYRLVSIFYCPPVQIQRGFSVDIVRNTNLLTYLLTYFLTYLLKTKGKKLKEKVRCRSVLFMDWKPTTELRSVTCHMGSHSVTCHPTHVNAPRL